MISYSVPAHIRPWYCLLCLLYGPGAKAVPEKSERVVELQKRGILDV